MFETGERGTACGGLLTLGKEPGIMRVWMNKTGGIGTKRAAMRRAWCIFTWGLVLLASGGPARAATASPEILQVQGEPVPAPDGSLRHRVSIDAEALLALPSGATARLSLPGRPVRTVIFAGLERHPGGSITWHGAVRGRPELPITITFGLTGLSGVLTGDADAPVTLQSDDQGIWISDRAAAGLAPADDEEVDDGLGHFDLPKGASREPLVSTTASAAAPGAAAANGMTLPRPAPAELDLLILYTTGLKAKLGTGLAARLDSLVAITNRSYVDSDVHLRLRPVAAIEIGYPDKNSNFDALYALTDGSHPTTAGVRALRDLYGADVVVLLRPYDSATQQGCGAGWISGFGGNPVEWSSEYGFSVVSDGASGGKYCDDVAFAHEIGHNLGAMHDRANAGGALGAYPFGYGYGVRGKFGTVMSYIYPRLPRYADPHAICSGLSCGVDENAADSANDSLAIELARSDVAAFRPSTHLDFAFGTAGRATLGTSAGVAGANAVAVASDGRIVVAGAVDRDASSAMLLMRFLPDGKPDPGFGSGGVVERSIAGGRLRATAVGLQSDGRIVVAGTLEKTTGDTCAVALRFLPDGKSDFSFAGSGTFAVGDVGQRRRFRALAISAADDDVILVGEADNSTTGVTSLLAARLTRDGAPRTGFGISGLLRQAVAGGSVSVDAIRLSGDGSIAIAGGFDRPDGREDLLALRLLGDGHPDPAFGGGTGMVRVDLGGGRAHANGIALERDGDLVLAGTWMRAGGTSAAVAVRLLADGTRDAEFGKKGTFSLDLGDGDTFANGVAVDAKGRIFVAGGYRDADGGTNFVTACLRKDGVRLRAFAHGGVAAPTFGGLAAVANAVAIAPDGGIVVAGATTSDLKGEFAVVRHLVD
ncbi:MAG: hypothetical protein RL698_3551 [Pseudomonadota bacterium]